MTHYEDVLARADIDADTTFPTLAPSTRARSRLGLEIASASDRGRVLERNDDHFLVAEIGRFIRVEGTNLSDRRLRPETRMPEATLLAVADGIGGHGHGDLASALALDTIAGDLLPFMPELAAHEEQAKHTLRDVLMHAAADAQRRLMEAVARKHVVGRTPGTTLTAALVRGRTALIVHIGDSRAYLVRGGRLERLTRDHTAGQAVRDIGSTAAPMLDAMLLNAIGGDTRPPVPDNYETDLELNDVLLLVTDGVTRYVSDEEIGQIASAEGPAVTTDRLLAMALERGGEDNATVIAVRFRGA